ncbi:MAG: DUF3868 domain-containing protein [Clostridium sp.]|nr:DUF3868 domain-containing protein [Clostridium sp.]
MDKFRKNAETMKAYIILLALAVAGALQARALNEVKSVQQWDADGAQMTREGDNLFRVGFDLDLDGLNVPSEEALVLTPVLCNGLDSLALPSVGIYGRNRYYHYERRGTGMISGPDETVYKNKEKPGHVAYEQVIPYRQWFNGANLVVKGKCYGCCFQLLAQNEKPLLGFMEPIFPIQPKYVYEAGDAEVTGELSGEANVQFVVDRWELHQDKFNNAVELGKITSSIDTVKSDPDLTITEIWLKGYASPEATWQHNTMLAKNRVAAVKDFVNKTAKIDQDVIVTEFQPEDWAGLRKWVENSNIDNKEGILAIIDEPVTDPEKDWDAKDRKLGQKYPAQRKFLLNTVYPPLRHTEYKIKYKVRRFLDRDEIRRVMHSEPSKLTLNDFNLAAEGYEPGSPEFNEVYDIMVRIHPNSEIANLNAANAALQSGNLAAAEKYLAKAGNSPEAEYSRGLLKLQQEDYAGAEGQIEKAAKDGISGAQDLLDSLKEYLEFVAKQGKRE